MKRLIIGVSGIKGLFFFVAVLASAFAFSQVLETRGGARVVVDMPIPPETIADSEIDFTPSRDAALNIPIDEDQTLDGQVKLVTGVLPEKIVVPANTMIAPLKAGVSVRMFLIRFPDRDAYYPIAIFPL